jgi:hypothetical protein
VGKKGVSAVCGKNIGESSEVLPIAKPYLWWKL